MTMEMIEPAAPETQSADLLADNLARLRALFPELVTQRQLNGKTGPASSYAKPEPSTTPPTVL